MRKNPLTERGPKPVPPAEIACCPKDEHYVPVNNSVVPADQTTFKVRRVSRTPRVLDDAEGQSDDHSV
jgi:hypothetical protein